MFLRMSLISVSVNLVPSIYLPFPLKFKKYGFVGIRLAVVDKLSNAAVVAQGFPKGGLGSAFEKYEQAPTLCHCIFISIITSWSLRAQVVRIYVSCRRGCVSYSDS